MWNALRSNWYHYLAEAGGLAFFMANAAWMTTLLESPGSPVHQAIGSGLARRGLLGAGMFVVVLMIVYAPWCQASGAHLSPSITWAFARLGKISVWDAALYTVGQFAGATLAVALMVPLLGGPFERSPVDYVATTPGPLGDWGALGAEVLITFGLTVVLLWGTARAAWRQWTGVAVALTIALYLVFETPLSGMSLNPARSFGSAVVGDVWTGYWVYVVGPTAGALAAGELFARCHTAREGDALPAQPPGPDDEPGDGTD